MDDGWVAQHIGVPPEHHGKRLDRFLQARFPWRSRAWVQRLLEEHGRDADGRPLKASRAVRAGERISLYFRRPEEPAVADVDVPVLFEDEDLFLVDKPPGYPVHAKGKQRGRALIQLLRRRHPELGLDLAHRLDRETSGVLVLTKHQAANAAVKRQLRDGEVRKEYLAIVRGVVLRDRFRVDLPLRPAHRSAIRMKMEVHAAGASAVTDVRVVSRHGGYTLVAAAPRTGRQHQIRAHLAAVGHGVVGDKIYGVPEEIFLRFDERGLDEALLAELELPRQALHAAQIELRHPRTATPVRVEAPFPSDLKEFLENRTCTSAGNAVAR